MINVAILLRSCSTEWKHIPPNIWTHVQYLAITTSWWWSLAFTIVFNDKLSTLMVGGGGASVSGITVMCFWEDTRYSYLHQLIGVLAWVAFTIFILWNDRVRQNWASCFQKANKHRHHYQQGPMSFRLSKKSSNAELWAPNTWEKVFPERSRGRWGYWAE